MLRKRATESVYNSTTLVHGLLSDAPLAQPFFVYKPMDQASFATRVCVIERYYQTDRKRLSQCLREYNQRLGAAGATLNNIQLLDNPETLVVVTGQQAGVLTGPLYTIHKAITTILLARQQAKRLDRPVVPVFWIASEDHDYAEINHTFATDHKGRVERLSLPFTPTGTPAAGQIELGPWADDFINMYLATVQGEYRQEVATLLTETRAKAQTLPEWFACIMTLLFSEHGLIIVDPMLVGLRQLLTGFFGRAIAVAEQIESRVVAAAKEIAHAGYQIPIQWRQGYTGLFLLSQGQRLPIQRKGSAFFVQETGQSWQAKELEAYSLRHPDQFSTNVVLRPLAQDVLLPTLAYVGGPGEISYYGQLKELYPLFELEMPVVYPRLSMTISAAAEQRFLEQHQLSFADVGVKGLTKLYHQLEVASPIDINGSVQAAKNAVQAVHSQLLAQLAKLDPQLAQLGPDNLERIHYQLDYLDKKAKQSVRKQNRQLLLRYEALVNRLRPQGKPQERVYPVFELVAKYGLNWLQELLQQDWEQTGAVHWLIELEQEMGVW